MLGQAPALVPLTGMGTLLYLEAALPECPTCALCIPVPRHTRAGQMHEALGLPGQKVLQARVRWSPVPDRAGVPSVTSSSSS